MSASADTATRGSPQSYVTIWTLIVTSTILVFEGSLISPALPAIQERFGDPFLSRLVLTITPLFVALSSPITGFVTDRWGRKPVLVGSTLIVAVAGGAGFVIDSLDTLLAARAVLGIGIGGVGVSSTALVTDYYTGERREQFLGWLGAAGGFGGVPLVILGGILVEVGWNVPFLGFLAVLLLLPFHLLYLWEPREVESASNAPTSVAEVRETIDVLEWRPLSLIYAVTVFGAIIFFLAIVQGPFIVTNLLGLSGAQIGIALAVFTFFMGVTGVLYERFKARFNVVAIYALMFLFLGIGYAVVGVARSYPVFLVGMAIGGFGLGYLLPNSNTWVSFVTDVNHRGRALGGVVGLFFFGQFLSPIITTPLALQYGYPTTFLGAAALLGVLALVFGVASRGRRRIEAGEPPAVA